MVIPGWKKAAAGLGLVLASGLTGCFERSPKEVYVDMTTSAMMGDREGFLEGFTERSRDLVGALISLSEAYGMDDSNPYELLVFDSVDDVTIEEDRAILMVRRRAQVRKILMVKSEDDEWRIDTRELEEFWEEHGRR
ncbi:MAG: hypothetical protein ACQEXJ_04790 [Myxococcota bacterium]